MTPDERASSQQDARPENPVVPDFFFQGKPRGQRHVELVKILWLILSNHISGNASSHGHIFEPQPFGPCGWRHKSDHGRYHGHDRSAHMRTCRGLTQVNDFLLLWVLDLQALRLAPTGGQSLYHVWCERSTPKSKRRAFPQIRSDVEELPGVQPFSAFTGDA